MPHLILDYSQNLRDKTDLQALCEKLHATLLDSGLFELGAVRVRAVPSEHFAIADLRDENAYLHMTAMIGKGRSGGQKRELGQALFETARGHLDDLIAARDFALTLELREINAAFSWKANGFHARLREQGG